MTDDSLRVLTAADVARVLAGEEAAVLQVVGAAYEAHGRGHSVLPHSSFLRFPDSTDRIIALPAYLGEGFEVAGIKWIASFPGNLGLGLPRASGIVVLNSLATGRPWAVVEGSAISAKRTAASAALAARMLHERATPTAIGLLGCGAVNFETLRFLSHVWPSLAHVVACDLRADRSAGFAARCREAFGHIRVEAVDDWGALVGAVDLLSIATTAMAPYVDDLRGGRVRTVLHLSLRDLTPEVVLAAANVVDDADHVCRAETSLHRAERAVGHRRFIHCSLPDLLRGVCGRPQVYDTPTIFSPFGLGILDIAVAQLVCERAEARGIGVRIPFAPVAA